MIMALLSDTTRSSGYSVDRCRSGFALGFVNQLAPWLVVLLVLAGRQAVLVVAQGVGRVGIARRLERALDAGHQVAQELLGDQQAALELDDRLGRGLEVDDVVRAFTVAVDRVGQPPAAPRGDLDDLASGGRQLTGDPVDQGLALVVGQVWPEDKHQFVSAHARMTPSCGNARAEPAVPGRSRKDKDASLAWARRAAGPARIPGGPLYPERSSSRPARESLCPPV